MKLRKIQINYIVILYVPCSVPKETNKYTSVYECIVTSATFRVIDLSL